MKRTFFGPPRSGGSVWPEVALVCVVAASIGAIASSCGGDVVVDEDGVSSSSGDGGASNTGTPVGPGPGPGPGQNSAVVGPSSNGPSVASTGVGASGPVAVSVGPGPGPAQVSSSSGMPDCVSCLDVVSGEEGPFCAGSEQIFDDLVNCVCSVCSGQCQNTCGGSAPNQPGCDQCVEFTIDDFCSMQFQTCIGDN